MTVERRGADPRLVQRSVLIVEDNELNMKLFNDLLAAHGYRVIQTRNGFDVDGVEIKCRLDFGAKAIDWRGLYKNPGT